MRAARRGAGSRAALAPSSPPATATGKTLGALSGTSKAVFRRDFGGGLLPFTHVPPNDVAALERAFESASFTGTDIAGVLLEPVLGEGGIYVLSDDFMRAARRLCDASGAALIFDEVQSGMGRTGRMWACEHSGVAPDIMAIAKVRSSSGASCCSFPCSPFLVPPSAKAFGGGVCPAGACVGTAKVWQKYLDNPFLVTTTCELQEEEGGGRKGAPEGTRRCLGWRRPYLRPPAPLVVGGNPLAMAAAIATLDVLGREGLVDAARDTGAALLASLQALQVRGAAAGAAERRRGACGRLPSRAACPGGCRGSPAPPSPLQRRFPRVLSAVRGRGLMIGLEFPSDDVGYAFSRGAFARRVILAGTLVNSRVIRVEPPLTITQADLVSVVARLGAVLDDMEAAIARSTARAAAPEQLAEAQPPAAEAPHQQVLASLKEEGDAEDGDDEEEDVPLADGRDRGISLPVRCADDETDCSSVVSSSTE